jgi:hypothetical protein
VTVAGGASLFANLFFHNDPKNLPKLVVVFLAAEGFIQVLEPPREAYL